MLQIHRFTVVTVGLRHGNNLKRERGFLKEALVVLRVYVASIGP